MKRFAPLFLLLCSLPLAAQQLPKFGEKLDVNLVLLDAVVTDAHGNQILGLNKNDFVVKENGVAQPIDSVDYFTNRTLLTSPESKAPFQVDRVHEARYFIFFFDKPSDNKHWDDVAAARASAKRFIEHLHPGDEVAIVGQDVRLKVYSDFTSNQSRLFRALDEVGSFGLGITSGKGPILSHVDHHRMMVESGTVYEALDVLGGALRSIRGRKDLILFSQGIYEPGQNTMHGMVLSESRYYRPMIDSLNAADVSVYAVNLLRSNAPDTPIFHQTLEQIAHDTNGEYTRHPVSFDPVLENVEKAASGYYMISYYSHHEKGTKGFQKVDVSLKVPDLQVKARAGYAFGQ